MESVGILRYFYLVGFANALFFSILIFSKPKRNLADKLLAWWLIVLSLQLLLPFLYLSDLNTYYRFAGIEITFYAIHPLLLYLYIKSTIGSMPSGKNLFLLILFSVIVELSAGFYFVLPSNERLSILIGEKPIQPFFYILFIPIIAYFIIYFILSIRALKNYKLNILHVYSYREDIDLLWLRRLVLFFYGLLLLTVPLAAAFLYVGISVAMGDYFYFAGLAFFIFFLGYWGYKQGEIFKFNAMIEEKRENHNNQQITNIIQNTFHEKTEELIRVMEHDKPFLNASLTIYELAKTIDIQPYMLSRLISHEFKCNFFEFINKYRIEIFKKYLFESKFKDYTFLAIALECGFNSKSAFNRIFKEQTGQTPTEFKKNILSDEVLKN